MSDLAGIIYDKDAIYIDMPTDNRQALKALLLLLLQIQIPTMAMKNISDEGELMLKSLKKNRKLSIRL